MKNLTIKKVALGLILAGFATSSAYAATTATTSKTIIGNAPIIKSTVTQEEGKYSYKVYRGTVDISTLSGDAAKPRVGDKIEVTFTYHDADGDAADPNWLSPANNALKGGDKLEFTIVGGSAIPASDITATHPGADSSSAKYEFIIPASAAGKGINISLTPMSEYGDPWKNEQIGKGITSIFDKDITDVPTPPGDCEDNPDTCIVDDTLGLKVQIVLNGTDIIYGSSDATEQTAAATYIPKIGDTFGYKVIDTFVSPANDVTGTYKGQWSYVGTNSNALGSKTAAATVEPTAAAIGATYKVDVNSVDLLSQGNNYEAGAQGFNLQVTVSK